jgi:ABC-type nitrate/sulfonate/bicarbonate transport system substrate-binding protein
MRSILAAAAAVLVTGAVLTEGQQLQKVTLNYPTRSGASWPLFLAREGGYYQKQGLDVTLVFAGHPAGIAMVVSDQAQMSSYNLESVMQASSRGDAPFTVVGASLNKAYFALMAKKDVGGIADLKGKTFAVSQIGDPPYNYTSAFLRKFGMTPRDVQWIAAGADATGRAAALSSGRADATLLTPPAYFRLEEAGFKNLGNLADHDDIFAATTYLMKKTTIAANPRLPEQIVKAQAEAIRRFYDDKAFAVKAYQAYDKQATADVERLYDGYAKANVLERVPYVLAPALQAVIDQQSDAKLLAQMKAFDFRTVIDNSVVARLVKEGFFQQLFGPAVKAEEDRKSKLAFR